MKWVVIMSAVFLFGCNQSLQTSAPETSIRPQPRPAHIGGL